MTAALSHYDPLLARWSPRYARPDVTSKRRPRPLRGPVPGPRRPGPQPERGTRQRQGAAVLSRRLCTTGTSSKPCTCEPAAMFADYSPTAAAPSTTCTTCAPGTTPGEERPRPGPSRPYPGEGRPLRLRVADGTRCAGGEGVQQGRRGDRRAHREDVRPAGLGRRAQQVGRQRPRRHRHARVPRRPGGGHGGAQPAPVIVWRGREGCRHAHRPLGPFGTPPATRWARVVAPPPHRGDAPRAGRRADRRDHRRGRARLRHRRRLPCRKSARPSRCVSATAKRPRSITIDVPGHCSPTCCPRTRRTSPRTTGPGCGEVVPALDWHELWSPLTARRSGSSNCCCLPAASSPCTRRSRSAGPCPCWRWPSASPRARPLPRRAGAQAVHRALRRLRERPEGRHPHPGVQAMGHGLRTTWGTCTYLSFPTPGCAGLRVAGAEQRCSPPSTPTGPRWSSSTRQSREQGEENENDTWLEVYLRHRAGHAQAVEGGADRARPQRSKDDTSRASAAGPKSGDGRHLEAMA